MANNNREYDVVPPGVFDLQYVALEPERPVLNYTELLPETDEFHFDPDTLSRTSASAAPMDPHKRELPRINPQPAPVYDRVLPMSAPQAPQFQINVPPPMVQVASPFVFSADPMSPQRSSFSAAPAAAVATDAPVYDSVQQPTPQQMRSSFVAVPQQSTSPPPAASGSPPRAAAIAAFSNDGVPHYYRDGIFDLTRFGWFHGKLSSVHANDLLRDQPPGSFLVRLSTKPGHFVIVHIAKKPKPDDPHNEPRHILVSPCVGGYRVQGNDSLWTTVPQIVNAWASKKHLVNMIDSRNASVYDGELRQWQLKAMNE